MATRVPQLGRLPKKLSERGWAGVRDGFTMPLHDNPSGPGRSGSR